MPSKPLSKTELNFAIKSYGQLYVDVDRMLSKKAPLLTILYLLLPVNATVMASGSLMHILDFWHTTSRTALIKRIDVDN